jgi:hypothetical protein
MKEIQVLQKEGAVMKKTEVLQKINTVVKETGSAVRRSRSEGDRYSSKQKQ